MTDQLEGQTTLPGLDIWCGKTSLEFCGEDMIAEADEYNFCPICGADMRGE